jgi:hypothetical protein
MDGVDSEDDGNVSRRRRQQSRIWRRVRPVVVVVVRCEVRVRRCLAVYQRLESVQSWLETSGLAGGGGTARGSSLGMVEAEMKTNRRTKEIEEILRGISCERLMAAAGEWQGGAGRRWLCSG